LPPPSTSGNEIPCPVRAKQEFPHLSSTHPNQYFWAHGTLYRVCGGLSLPTLPAHGPVPASDYSTAHCISIHSALKKQQASSCFQLSLSRTPHDSVVDVVMSCAVPVLTDWQSYGVVAKVVAQWCCNDVVFLVPVPPSSQPLSNGN